MFRLAHISDVHLPTMPEIRWPQLMNKRITGYLNWKLNRSHAIGPDYLGPLIKHMQESAPDHVAVTGDLVNLSLPLEFLRAREFLEALGKPEDISVICGNHDAYVPGAVGKAIRAWEVYMGSPEHPVSRTQDFPYVRLRDDIALIGCNSAEATAPFMAKGYFRRRQARALSKALEETRDRFRVVMIHHPPVHGATRFHKRLIGTDRFRKVIASAGAELILHGHTHLADFNTMPGPDGQVPVIGVPAAGTNLGKMRPAGRYNLFEIDGKAGSWSVSWSAYGASPDTGKIAALDSRKLY